MQLVRVHWRSCHRKKKTHHQHLLKLSENCENDFSYDNAGTHKQQWSYVARLLFNMTRFLWLIMKQVDL